MFLSNTHMNTVFLKSASILSLALGVTLMISGSISTVLEANLTGVGSTVIERSAQPVLFLPGHASAPIAAAPIISEGTGELLAGMIFFIIGLLLYSLLQMHKTERRVHITSIPSQNAVPLRTKRKGQAFYWMEIRI